MRIIRKNLKSVLFLFAMLSFSLGYAQVKTVTGTVSDAGNGEPLPGVTIVVKGTTQGTITDFDGNFSIDVEQGQTIVLSYIGYTQQEVVITASNLVNVKLEQSMENLDEVVVIGYGQIKKDDATGSVATVSSSDFNQGSSSSPQDLIMGKVPGVHIQTEGGAPGSAAKIRIRGGSSMSASNDPLVVIDGMPIDNRTINGMSNVLTSINPNDIETMTVLKDASAAAIYGSRASNGVILITTKQGLKNQKLKIEIDSKINISQIKEYIDVLNADEFRTLVNERAAISSAVNPELLGNSSTNWQDEIFQTAIGHEHNLGISGSVKSIPVRASIGYTDQFGILRTSSMERKTGTLKITPSFFDNHLSINAGIKYMNIDNSFADKGAIGSALRFDPTKPVFNNTGIYGGYTTWLTTDGSRNINGTRNPVAQLQQKSDISDVDRYIIDAQVNYKLHFFPDITATLKVGLDKSNSDGSVDTDLDASWVRTASSGVARDYTQERKNELLDFYLTYKKDLPGIESRVDAMAGYEWQHFWSAASAYEVDRFNTVIEDSKDETENYLVSFFGRANYSYKDKYLLTVTLRNDGSSRFHKDNRWGLYPSTALGWRLIEEPFIKELNTFSNLKLRLGYGITGQQELNSGDYPYLGVYQLSDSRTQYMLGDQYYTLIRPNGFDSSLEWEETSTFNAAVDFGFINNRITGSIDVYKRITKNLLNTIPVPAGTNFTDRLLTNVGDLENTGIELAINALPVVTNDLTWEVSFNLTHNKNKVTRLTNYDDPNYTGVDVGDISGVGVGNKIQKHSVGHALNTFYVYQQVYDTNGKPIEGVYVDRNNDGEINVDDKYYADSPEPDVFMGFSSMLTYKNFDFGFNARAAIGGQIYNNVLVGARYQEMTVNEYLTNLPSEINNSKFTTAQQYSDYFLEDASFFRVDNMTLGYNLRDILKNSFGLNLNARLYGSVQNVFVITNYSGLDPEVNNGIDNDIYPRPRVYLFGMNITF
ncbi:SusC/RagA family TonB-linked outer membrane protein [Draconibacterium mangrovi]|uniref:SusC/RagA family TonB-linked outer membrane protein n=1 Tax=Draconibacterium mangrovi TaxID=2697469 RepID=UPI0013D6B5F3|nr:TonB-dependent receptor [Draconibacterium mangrovi]